MMAMTWAQGFLWIFMVMFDITVGLFQVGEGLHPNCRKRFLNTNTMMLSEIVMVVEVPTIRVINYSALQGQR